MDTTATHATTYEYRTVEIAPDLEPLARDTYTNLGWMVEPASKTTGGLGQADKRIMSMKRDRRIGALAQLRPLQADCDQALASIESLEATKTVPASVAAYSVGIVGCAFLALSVFSYLAGAVALMIAFAIPGFICWILPYLLFKGIGSYTATKRAAQVGAQYERIYAASERGADILSRQAATA